MKVFGQHPWWALLFVLVAIALNAAGYYFNLWDRVAIFDDVVHGYTLLAITLVVGLVLLGPVLNASGRRGFWVVVALMFIGVGIGAWWEIGEWLYDQSTVGNVIAGKTDTIIDLLMDSIGALLGAWLAFEWKAGYER